MGMKINLAGLVRQAAALIPPKKDTGAYAYMLNELADHIGLVRSGEATLAEFAALYGLERTDG